MRSAPIGKTILFTCLVVALLGAVGCGRGPSLPNDMSYEGRPLEKAASWSGEGVEGVVFVPPGEELPNAALQVGVLVSRERPRASQLHDWVMEKYRGSPTTRWHESTAPDEACKVGMAAAGVPRPFVALHICRASEGTSACAEIDEQLDGSDVGRCLQKGTDCWDELCTETWLAKEEHLLAILDDVLGPH
jgi:hypothetical protein